MVKNLEIALIEILYTGDVRNLCLQLCISGSQIGLKRGFGVKERQWQCPSEQLSLKSWSFWDAQ